MSSGVGLLLYHCMAKFFLLVFHILTCVALIIFFVTECNLVLLVVTYKIMSCFWGGMGSDMCDIAIYIFLSFSS